MIVTNDEELAEKCRSLRNLCFEPSRRFIHQKLGWNFRMSNLQAALGLAQLEQIDEFIERKRSIGQKYSAMLNDISTIQLPKQKTDYADNIYWVYGIVIKDRIGLKAHDVIERLSAMKIGSRPFFWPMNKQPVLNNMGFFLNESYPVSEKIAELGFYIPSGLAITESQMESVADSLHIIFP
jgi:perosamine synthetase